jgi:aminomethyltransferase
VNAANQEKDFRHLQAINRFDASVDFASERYAQLAVQGPQAAATVQKLTATHLSTIRYYRFADGEVGGVAARIARTGYTGEDCFELFIPPDAAASTWDAVMDAGAEFGIKPCGLGARNTLRLEAGMALYGHEISASITPLEAGLGRNCDMTKEFVGKPALERQQKEGVRRQLAGFEMAGRGIARDGYEVFVGGRPAGWVTSGSPSPTLNKNIGMCYLPAGFAAAGGTIQVMIRGQLVEAVTRPAPFYKRPK